MGESSYNGECYGSIWEGPLTSEELGKPSLRSNFSAETWDKKHVIQRRDSGQGRALTVSRRISTPNHKTARKDRLCWQYCKLLAKIQPVYRMSSNMASYFRLNSGVNFTTWHLLVTWIVVSVIEGEKAFLSYSSS